MLNLNCRLFNLSLFRDSVLFTSPSFVYFSLFPRAICHSPYLWRIVCRSDLQCVYTLTAVEIMYSSYELLSMYFWGWWIGCIVGPSSCVLKNFPLPKSLIAIYINNSYVIFKKWFVWCWVLTWSKFSWNLSHYLYPGLHIQGIVKILSANFLATNVLFYARTFHVLISNQPSWKS